VGLDWLSAELEGIRQQRLDRKRRTFQPLPDGWCELDGQRLRNLGSNDYLNLAHDARLIEAARAALLESGAGATASALVCGRTRWHAALEEALTEFEGTEGVVLFPTGYAANTGTLTALIRPDDLVCCDRFNHASLVDGCRLSGARLRVYRHDRLEVLERELKAAVTETRRWIVTDGVFSMDGDLAPLSDLCDLAERYGAAVIADEAHGTGVFGVHGRGACEHTGTEHRVAVRIGTLSKAVGTQGGFVAGSADLCDWLWNAARTQMFATALPPSICAAAAQAVRVIQTEPERIARLHRVCGWFQAAMRAEGLPVDASQAGPIQTLEVGSVALAVAAAESLKDAGYFVPAIRPPTVPQGRSRLRISLTSALAESDLTRLAGELRRVLTQIRAPGFRDISG